MTTHDVDRLLDESEHSWVLGLLATLLPLAVCLLAALENLPHR